MRPFPFLILSTALALGACREAKVEAYRVPKEQDPTLPAQAPAGDQGGPAMASTAVPTESGAALAWSAPAGWKAKPLTAMRKGSYTVPGEGGKDGDLSVTAFPGNVGGELANVNRWRGQVGLRPLGEADLAGSVTRLTRNGLSFTVVDAAGGPGPGDQRILGAIVPFGEGTWFFKLAGPSGLLEREKARFLGFLDTVKPGAQP
jgi:hypothetical protein